MIAVVADEYAAKRLIAERKAKGLDRYDEVWDGEYYMPPIAGIEHQDFGTRLATVLSVCIQWEGLGDVFQGVNVSDREDDWEKNYRIPDVAVFLNDTTAQNRGSHWFGGPDFAVEIVSPGDRSRMKLPFYAAVGTREVLLIDRQPWRLELYRLTDGRMERTAESDVNNDFECRSDVLPLRFDLVVGEPRPKVRVRHTHRDLEWVV